MDTLSSNTPQNKPQKRKPKGKCVTLQCAYCKKFYDVRASHASRSQTHYCSRECFKAEINLRVHMKSCAFCGKEIRIIQSLLAERNYCSVHCQRRHRKQLETGIIYTQISIACLKCGKSFEVLNTSKRKFCSQQCAYTYRVGPNMHNYKGNIIDCICMFCGSSFQKPEAWVKKGEGKFCSATCRSSFTIQKQGGMVSSIEITVKDTLEHLGENFHHQHRIGRFLVDFYLPERNLVIEADGEYWHSLEKNKRRDIKKDQYMKDKHINLARLKESDIRSFCEELVRTTLSQFPKKEMPYG